MNFHDDDDAACSGCKQLMIILRDAPENYAAHAEIVRREVDGDERRRREPKEAEQANRAKTQRARSLLAGAEEPDEAEERSLNLMELLRLDNPDQTRPILHGHHDNAVRLPRS